MQLVLGWWAGHTTEAALAACAVGGHAGGGGGRGGGGVLLVSEHVAQPAAVVGHAAAQVLWAGVGVGVGGWMRLAAQQLWLVCRMQRCYEIAGALMSGAGNIKSAAGTLFWRRSPPTVLASHVHLPAISFCNTKLHREPTTMPLRAHKSTPWPADATQGRCGRCFGAEAHHWRCCVLYCRSRQLQTGCAGTWGAC